MRLAVTGGGTGGHVFPALEVARQARSNGWEVLYLGSLRGQEGHACRKVGLPFHGFPSEPLYSLKSLRGVKAAVQLARSTLMARRALRVARPDAVFSTGGYSSAPLVTAARQLGIPYVVHEQNSVPGRSNLMAATGAYAVATTFEGAARHFEGPQVVRTGLPVRQELRDAASNLHFDLELSPLGMLVFGGSQGAAAINEAALATAARMVDRQIRWTHVTGKAHFETMFASYEKLGIGSIYDMKSFLEGQAMADAYSHSALVVSRSGAGTLSELAAFRLPSVLIPYPEAYANHQLANAMEFADLGAATVIEQPLLHPSSLEGALRVWMDDGSRREQARIKLAEWDRPDAANAILDLLKAAGGRKR